MVTALAYDAETLNKKELIARDGKEKVNDDENTASRHESATVSQSKKCDET